MGREKVMIINGYQEILACWKFGTNKKEAERERGVKESERERSGKKEFGRERGGIKSDERVSRNRVGSETL